MSFLREQLLKCLFLREQLILKRLDDSDKEYINSIMFKVQSIRLRISIWIRLTLRRF